jgi:1,2-diacylglycerol 3-alpha-glucosyltransferase
VIIVHICLSNWYVDGWQYQENELIKQHIISGHDVSVIASTEIPDSTGFLNYVLPKTYFSPEGAKIIRIPYIRGPRKLMAKLRFYSGLTDLLNSIRPDAIMFHGSCAGEIITAARYAKANPHVIFYVDSHEDRHNSARTFLSREILHKLYYRFCLQRALPQIRKILCCSLESMDFVHETYGVDRERLEFFPLGGVIPSDGDYKRQRDLVRQQMGLAENQTLFTQAGKQTRAKKLIETLRSFIAAAPVTARLVIAGSLDAEIKGQAEALIASDARVTFSGWLNPEQLTSLLCACDVYLQPGTQSVNFQQSLCCRCAPIVHDYPSHHPFVQTNGWLIQDEAGLAAAIRTASNCNIGQKQAESLSIARQYLDYATMAKRVLR